MRLLRIKNAKYLESRLRRIKNTKVFFLYKHDI